MITYLGDFKEDASVYIMFNTFSSDDPSASCTITNFINTDVHIHKDDGVIQRNNAAGITVSVDFDGITGSHMVKIDTSDDTVAGFWVVGHEYFVRIEGTTIDGATINSVIGQFSIENRFNEVDVVKWLGTAAATPTVAGVPEVDVTHWVSGAIGSPTVAGVPEIDLIRISGDSQSRIDFKDFVDNGYDPATNKVQGVVLVDTCTTNSDLVSAAAIVNEWETQSQADPTGFHVNVKEVNGTAQTANDNSADINTLLTRITAAVALASICTETRLAELDAANIPSDAANGYASAASAYLEVSDGTYGNSALKTLIDTIDGIVDNILLDTAEIGTAGAGLTDLGGMSDAMKTEVNNEAKDVLTVDTIADGYATDGNQPTIAQAILAIQQMMQEKSITGTTLTVKKPDGSTSAMTFTLDSATVPTSITRAT